MGAGWGAFRLIEQVHGTIPSWPAVLWPWRVVLFAAPALGGLLVAAIVNRFLGFAPALAFAFGAWLLFAVLLASLMPGAAGVLIAPLLFALLLVTLATSIRNAGVRSLLVAVSLAIAVTQTLGVVIPLEQSQGYRSALAMFPFIALFMVLIAPIVRGREAVAAIGVLAVIAGVGIVGAVASPLYSPWRPQHVNVNYYANLDTGQAWWSLDSEGPAPGAMLRSKDFAVEEVTIYPWSPTYTVDVTAAAPAPTWPGPNLQTVSDATSGQRRTLVLDLTPTRPVHVMSLVIPESAKAQRVVVEGVEAQAVLLDLPMYRGHYLIQVMGMRDRPVRVTLVLASTDPVAAWLAEESPMLPAGAQVLMDARKPLATAVHTADSSMLYRRVTL
jgi:hypothetical protein